MSASEVDDREATHPNDRVRAIVVPLVVGTAVHDLFGHTTNVIRRKPFASYARNSHDAAHAKAP
jgi:hypothetical protein